MGDVVGSNCWKSRIGGEAEGFRQRGPADPYVAAMKRARTKFDRLLLAWRALAHDEDCIEARLVAAAACQDEELRLIHLNIAVEAGEMLWGSAEGLFDLGGVSGVRPWLEAIKALGDAFAEAGDIDSAAECFDRLLRLDAADSLGAMSALERVSEMRAPAMMR